MTINVLLICLSHCCPVLSPCKISPHVQSIFHFTWPQLFGNEGWSSWCLSGAANSDGFLLGPLHQGRPSSGSANYQDLTRPHTEHFLWSIIIVTMRDPNHPYVHYLCQYIHIAGLLEPIPDLFTLKTGEYTLDRSPGHYGVNANHIAFANRPGLYMNIFQTSIQILCIILQSSCLNSLFGSLSQ